MAGDLSKQQAHRLVAIKGLDAKQIFTGDVLHADTIKIPKTFHSLPDFRPASEHANAQALDGSPPQTSRLSRFDPFSGPFSLVEAASCPWSQSLEFLRDIKTASIGSQKLTRTWIATWLAASQATGAEKPNRFFSTSDPISKSERLVWRSRRILNCLSHILPIVDSFDFDTQAVFWSQLFGDISKIGTLPTTLWDSLKEGFDPVSTRALWLRRVAILGVEAALGGYLQRDIVDKSLEHIRASIQSDGMMNGGSIVATLAGGADLCMLVRIAPIDPILEQMRLALVCLRHSEGTLVTFGAGSGEHAQLLAAVIGPGSRKPSNMLLGSGVGRMSANDTIIWLQAPQSNRNWAATCEIEAKGTLLLTSFSATRCAVRLPDAIQVSHGRCKRRDEPEYLVLEASAKLSILGKNYDSVRQIRVAQDGSLIKGEDVIRPETNIKEVAIDEICFGIPSTSKCLLSKDNLSVLIVTSQQQAWRFRVQGMDFTLEIRSERPSNNDGVARQQVIACKRSKAQSNSDFRVAWQVVLEEIA